MAVYVQPNRTPKTAATRTSTSVEGQTNYLRPDMLSIARARGLERAIASTSSISLPSFLVPTFQTQTFSRSFSSSPSCASHIGGSPLSIPPEVKFEIIPALAKKGFGAVAGGPTVNIEGPLGKLSMTIPPYVNLTFDAATKSYLVSVQDREIREQRSMWGTTRVYLNNHILGVSEGHTAILRLVGVGYRATVENSATTAESEFEGQQFVSLKVGYSHPIELPVPKGVKASVPQPTRILLEGCEKEVLMQFAAKIRAWRVPEPYKGKGIFVNGEVIKLKAKKIK